MKKIIITFSFLLSLKSIAQKKIQYYDYKWKECDASAARFASIKEKKDSIWHRDDYFVNLKKLQMDGYYEDDSCKIQNGSFHYFYANGNPQHIGRYKHGKKDGLWMSYHSNGMISDSIVYQNGNQVGISLSWYPNGFIRDSIQLDLEGKGAEVAWFDNGKLSYSGRFSEGHKMEGKWEFYHKNGIKSAVEIYDKGKLIDKSYFDEEGITMTDTTNKEKEAQFPGKKNAWSKYLSKQLYFPLNYQIVNSDAAVVVVDFIINEEGNVENAFVKVPFYPEFDKIALEAVRKSPKWKPAFQNNRNVKYYASQPVIFNQE